MYEHVLWFSSFRAVKAYRLVGLQDEECVNRYRGISKACRDKLENDHLRLTDPTSVYFNSFQLKPTLSGEISIHQQSRVCLSGLNLKRRLAEASDA